MSAMYSFLLFFFCYTYTCVTFKDKRKYFFLKPLNGDIPFFVKNKIPTENSHGYIKETDFYLLRSKDSYRDNISLSLRLTSILIDLFNNFKCDIKKRSRLKLKTNDTEMKYDTWRPKRSGTFFSDTQKI